MIKKKEAAYDPVEYCRNCKHFRSESSGTAPYGEFTVDLPNEVWCDKPERYELLWGEDPEDILYDQVEDEFIDCPYFEQIDWDEAPDRREPPPSRRKIRFSKENKMGKQAKNSELKLQTMSDLLSYMRVAQQSFEEEMPDESDITDIDLPEPEEANGISPSLSEEEARDLGEMIGINWEEVKFSPGSLVKGFTVELEHGKLDPETNVTNDDKELTAKIAWNHLKELPDYYERLEKMEKEGQQEAQGEGEGEEGLIEGLEDIEIEGKKKLFDLKGKVIKRKKAQLKSEPDPDEENILHTMRLLIGNSPELYENNATKLAEDTADDLEKWEWLDDPNHVFWDMAVDVLEEEKMLW